MIDIVNATKSFYHVTAVNDVTFSIPRGEVIGVLGPNGAGKSTLFKLIAGLLQLDNGRISPRNGQPWPAIGYKPDRLLFPNHLRVSQYLEMIASLSNIPNHLREKAVYDSLMQVDLVNMASRRLRDCSKGMRQRVGLAQVLMGDPPLLLLDEPSNGLDPAGQADMNRRIQELHAAGKTILISSHQLPDVTRVCSQLIILNNGRIHYQNSMETALALRSHIIIYTDRDLYPIQGTLLSLHEDILIDGTSIMLRGESMKLRRQILTMLLTADFDIIHVEEKKVTLGEVYAEAVQ